MPRKILWWPRVTSTADLRSVAVCASVTSSARMIVQGVGDVPDLFPRRLRRRTVPGLQKQVRARRAGAADGLGRAQAADQRLELASRVRRDPGAANGVGGVGEHT